MVRSMRLLILALAVLSSPSAGGSKALAAWNAASKSLASELLHGEWCRPGKMGGMCEIHIPGLDLQWMKGRGGWVDILKLNSPELSVSMLPGSKCVSIRRQPRDGSAIGDALLVIEAGDIILMADSARCDPNAH